MSLPSPCMCFLDVTELSFHIVGDRKHDARVSVKRDSFFHHMNVNLNESLKLTYWWTRKMKASEAANEAAVSRPTAIFAFQSFREITAQVMIENGQPIGGYDADGKPKIGELDEAKFGKMKFNKVSCLDEVLCDISY